MLHPKNNRIDYGEQLVPPPGYEFDRAIGTSYSLDLEALMILPVALFYAQNLDGTTDTLRYDMLDAITKATDKITLYYQNGQLKVPQKYHYLMAYWETGIVPVTMPDHTSSFHPKVWVIRYTGKDLAPSYRVMVTSRNLTFARDWDMAFSTEGIVSDIEQPKNEPLVHFLHYLNKAGKNRIPPIFLNDLLKVKFDVPETFETLRFIPIGIPHPKTLKIYSNPITKTNAQWDEMLIVSPFADKTTLDTICSATKNQPYLLSRKEELDCIDPETLKAFDCWQFATYFQEVEFLQELEEDHTEPFSQQLHAKLFIGMQKQTPYWYLGSANCTNPAQARNVEFMVELKGGNSKGLRSTDVYKALTDPSYSNDITLFTEYDPEARIPIEERKSIELEIRKIKFALSKLPLKGEANLIEGGTVYALAIQVDATSLSLPPGYTVSVKPLPENQKKAVEIQPGQENSIAKFGGYPETALSIFLIFEIAKDETIYSQFLLPMEIEMPRSRLNKIFSALIDSQEKFLKYLTFLLTGEETGIIKNVERESNHPSGNGNGQIFFPGAPVYEKLLIAASRFPQKLKSIDILVQRLKEESTDQPASIITKPFEDLWNVFKTFIKNKNL